VDKIPFIHSSGGVYYHHYPFFLSKLTKKGKPSRLRTDASSHTTDGKAGMTRTPFCLQKEQDAPAATGTGITTCMQDRQANHPNPLQTSSTVEKVLHIHRTGCAERPFFLLASFLSNIGSASIQCLSSRSAIA
jgi:hypothetical protein